MTSVSAGHIIHYTQPLGSGQPQRGSNQGPPHQESRPLPALKVLAYMQLTMKNEHTAY